MDILALIIISLFGLYSIFVAILLIITGRYSKNWLGAIVRLLTATVELLIGASAIYAIQYEIFSDTTLWAAVGVLMVLNCLVYFRWGRTKAEAKFTVWEVLHRN